MRALEDLCVSHCKTACPGFLHSSGASAVASRSNLSTLPPDMHALEDLCVSYCDLLPQASCTVAAERVQAARPCSNLSTLAHITHALEDLCQ
jgi:hypothetical protein